MNLTDEQRVQLHRVAADDGLDAAITACERMIGDNLAFQLLELGGYGTLQLNVSPHALPRMRFVDPGEVIGVNVARMDWPTTIILSRQTRGSVGG